ncbi:CG32298, partial [Drosophila busckii]
MDALRKKFSSLFNRSMPLGDQPVRVCEEPKTTDVAQLMQLQQQQQQQQQSQAQQSADEADLREIPNVQLQSQPKQLQLHTTEVTLDLNRALHNDHNERIIPPINYKMEFINFIEHNAPQGFAQKLNDMLPYLGLSFISWPTYWLWRSFRWHEKRRSERIALYIQRTFQHAKLMQLAILATGLF